MLCYVHLRRRSSLQIFPKPLGVHLGVSISETNTRYERTDDKILKEGIAYDQQITTVFSNDSYQTRGISRNLSKTEIKTRIL